MKRSKRKAIRSSATSAVPFKVAVHLGVLRGKLARNEITAEAIPELLTKGQNGGGPTRAERRIPKQLAAKVAKKTVNKCRMV